MNRFSELNNDVPAYLQHMVRCNKLFLFTKPFSHIWEKHDFRPPSKKKLLLSSYCKETKFFVLYRLFDMENNSGAEQKEAGR